MTSLAVRLETSSTAPKEGVRERRRKQKRGEETNKKKKKKNQAGSKRFAVSKMNIWVREKERCREAMRLVSVHRITSK